MNARRIEFRMFLFEEIKSKYIGGSNNIISELKDFSETPEFEKAFVQWDMNNPRQCKDMKTIFRKLL